MIEFKKSWDTFRETDLLFLKIFANPKAISEIPYIEEIRCIIDFGVGLFHFICSVIPKNFLFIIEGIGFKADRSLAVDELKRSMRCESGFRCKLFFFHN